MILLEKKRYSREALLDKIVLLTGGGGGIGIEAARALAYMGAKVIIAEIDVEKGKAAQKRINGEFHNENVDFFQVDLSDEGQIDALCTYVMGKYARLDAIINNAAAVPMGAVEAVHIAAWDRSYAVNLRAPVLLAQKLLPYLRESGGAIVFNPSAPGPYMSAYEIFKSAQVELISALDVELAGSGVIVCGVAPGFVKTETCVKAVEIVAAAMGMTADEFNATAADITTDAETAGAGYAVSVVNAEKYRGQVTSSYQALLDAGLLETAPKEPSAHAPDVDTDKLMPLITDVAAVFEEQYNGWLKKNMFFRTFVLNDFKKHMGMPAEAFKRKLEGLHDEAQSGRWNDVSANKEMFIKLQSLYARQRDMLAGFEKDPAQLKSDTALMNGWIDTLQKIIDELN